MKSLVKHFMCIALIVLGAMGAWAQTNNTINLATVTSNITVNNGYTLTGTLGANVQISIANGATVTLNNVTINGVDNSSYNWAGITCNGNATIILVGENTVKGFYSYRSGIYVPENSTLTIQGSGSLTASSNGNGAGIGSNTGSSGGNINIAGGTITATGGDRCAGIGGCGGGSCGNINITGGMVTATGGNSAPGIGGGQGSSCGSITIANTVTGIRAVKGGGYAQASYSIGAGQGGICGTVTVNGNVSNGITTNPYSYPSYTLDDIPTGWTVRADNQTVSVTDGVASIPVGAAVVLTPPNPDKPRVNNVNLLTPEQIPLTFEAMVAGAKVKFTLRSEVVTGLVEYSTDGITWSTYTSDTYIPLANVGDKVSFRGKNAAYGFMGSGIRYSHFSCSDNCYVYGNVMSLIDSTGFATNKELTADYALSCLFINNDSIYSHASKELVLPACTLTKSCYHSMFQGCSHLTSAPTLPATTMVELCYQGMFNNCTGLTTAPALPATTLASRCYSSMFKGCTNLTAAPELPAPTLPDYCYDKMFNGCTSLNKVTCLATSGINYMHSTNQWLAGVASSGTFYKPTSMTTWPTNNVNGIPPGWTEKPSETFLPLTFEAKEANATVTFTKASTLSSLTIEYSTDGTTWETYESPITLADSGDKVSFRGDNAHYATNSVNDEQSKFSCSAGCYIYGNIMSLINKDNFANTTILTNNNNFTFCMLFYNNNMIYNHESKPLLLPATTLAPSCYRGMFQGCAQLTTAPVLPAKTLASFCYCDMFLGCTQLTTTPELSATTLTNSCYRGMFQGCTQLTTAPVLPATTLANYCYAHMFRGCTNLETTPVLSVTTLAEGCYSNMFYDCTKLTTAPVLPATNLTQSCYSYMFDGCTNLETAPVLPAPNLAQWCYSHMFDGCSKLTTAPALPATTLANNCYDGMFEGCTNLETAPALPATTLANNCYAYMFDGCTKLTTAPTLPATTLANNCYAYMFDGCTELEAAPALPATILANNCYAYMFYGCTKLGIAPTLPATTLAQWCYSNMFNGCTLLTTAPTLPATTLTDYCYNYMFYNCTHLKSVTCLATDISANNCTYYWLSGVASTGTFYKAASMTTWPTGPYDGNVDGIPTGWTVDDYYDPLATPLTFEAQTAGAVVRFTKGSSVTWTNIVEYSLNGGTWMTYTQGTDITLTNMGDKVSFRGNNAKYATSMSDIGAQYSNFSCTNNCYVYGNIMSLIDADDYPTMTVLTSDNSFAFCNLFTGNTNIYNHPSKTLVLPATTLAYRCYGRMFYGCSSLTSTPELLATTLAEGCCYQMFYGCSSLTSAPALLATTLADQCCYNMFHGCSSLSSAPALPATTLASSCYSRMFQNCTSLSSAPALPATTLANYCYSSMFYGCSNLTSAPALPATTLANYCYSSMFYGCSNLTSAPVLPATTLANHCYESMFQGCTILTSAPALPATTLSVYCYSSMFYGCSNLTSAPVLPATTLANHCYESMFQGCTILTSAPALPATTLSMYCYYLMFQGCSNLTSAPELPATTLAEDCYREMFKDCTSLTSAPVLPATTLANYCYSSMFYGCSNLNSVTCLATNISAYKCTTDWLYGVPDISTSTFTKASGIDAGGYGWPRSKSGIPSNWTVVSVLDLSTVTANTTVPNGCVVTGTLNGNYKISIADGATVTLSGVTINGTNSESYSWAGLNCLGDATIILADGTTNTVKGFYEYYPGIHIPESSTLTIQGELAGTGTLNASSNGHGAGIGGGYNISCGNITISGGTVAATGGMDAAGIGSGYSSSCGDITIQNTVTRVTATKGSDSDNSIGAGYNSTCGTVTIGGVTGPISTSPYTYIPGALSGTFTINGSGDQVYFSQGNQQYQANSTGATEAPYTGAWRFAGNQYDMIGSNNANISESYTGWIDLFGWGTGDAPTKATTSDGDYSTFTDWGVNAISNGGNTANLWRTLTKDEWVYLFNNHTKGWSTVNGVGGYVIRPDGVSTAVSSSYTASAWATEEAAGSVFLPAAGSRGGTTFNAGVGGDYWSSTPNNSTDAYYLYFYSGTQNPAASAGRFGGRAVRLVRDAN